MNAALRFKLKTPAERAKLVTDMRARADAYHATPMAQMQRLFKAASTAEVPFPHTLTTSQRNEQFRRLYVLRAWAAVRCAELATYDGYQQSARFWRAEAHAALLQARWCRRNAAGFRKEGQ